MITRQPNEDEPHREHWGTLLGDVAAIVSGIAPRRECHHGIRHRPPESMVANTSPGISSR